MDKNQFEKNWNQLKYDVQNNWNKLTSEDIEEIDGMYDQFVSCLSQRYGYPRDTAVRQIENWEWESGIEASPTEGYQPHANKGPHQKVHEFKQTPHRHEKSNPAHNPSHNPAHSPHQKKRKAV